MVTHMYAHVNMCVFFEEAHKHEQDWKEQRNPTHVCDGRKRLFQYLILARVWMPRLYCSTTVSEVGGGGGREVNLWLRVTRSVFFLCALDLLG